MKKTINANIGGMIFHLDEDAYEKCKSYLDTIKAKFSKVEGGDEIIVDIEWRIAEIFKEKLGGSREVVSLDDVTNMVAIMGDPNSFMDEETIDTTTPTENQPMVKRRLFRDPDKRILGGVCSGFGAYFNIDPWVVRIIMIALVLFVGVTFLLYFVFWIAMPKAVTTADRLMMKGKKVDVNSIEESVKKEWNETKSGLRNAGKNVGSSSALSSLGKLIRVAFGLCFIFFSTLTLAIFIWAMCSPSATIHIDQMHISIREAAGMVFDSFGEKAVAYISAWLLIVVPSVLFIYLGIRAILQFKHKMRYVMLGGFLLWMIGLVMCIYTVINVAEKNKMESSTKENPSITIQDSAIVKLSVLGTDDIQGYNLEGYPIENVNFDIAKNTIDSFPTIEITKRSQGKDKQYAFNMAQKINYFYKIDSNQIKLAPYFMLNKGDKFRGQQVDIKLLLPIGYQVYLAKGTEQVINNISNVQEVWDHHMPEHTWTMTKEGLNCNDCEEDIIRKGKHGDEDTLHTHETNVKIKITDEDGEHEVNID